MCVCVCDLTSIEISTNLEITYNFITFTQIGNSITLIFLTICTISAYFKLILYKDNNFPSVYFTRIKIRIKTVLAL